MGLNQDLPLRFSSKQDSKNQKRLQKLATTGLPSVITVIVKGENVRTDSSKFLESLCKCKVYANVLLTLGKTCLRNYHH